MTPKSMIDRLYPPWSSLLQVNTFIASNHSSAQLRFPGIHLWKIVQIKKESIDSLAVMNFVSGVYISATKLGSTRKLIFHGFFRILCFGATYTTCNGAMYYLQSGYLYYDLKSNLKE